MLTKVGHDVKIFCTKKHKNMHMSSKKPVNCTMCSFIYSCSILNMNTHLNEKQHMKMYFRQQVLLSLYSAMLRICQLAPVCVSPPHPHFQGSKLKCSTAPLTHSNNTTVYVFKTLLGSIWAHSVSMFSECQTTSHALFSIYFKLFFAT